MATQAHPEGSVMCLIDLGTDADDLAIRTGDRLARAIEAPLTVRPVPRPGAVDWPAGGGGAAMVIASAERRLLASLLHRDRSPELASRREVPAVLVTEDAGPAVRSQLRGELVCGIDHSPAARSAALTASALAARLRLPLALVHAQEPIAATAMPAGGGGVAAPVLEQVNEETRDAGWDLLGSIDEITPERGRLRLRRGRAARCLSDYASRHDAPLIVVGAPEHGALSALMFGSTAWELCRTAAAPVMYVPEGFVPPW